jgi:hypothetical protein
MKKSDASGLSERQLADIARKGERIFLNPGVQYPWRDIVNGASVRSGHGVRKYYAVAPNTLRSFHRIDKTKSGAFLALKSYFTQNQERLVEALSGTSDFQGIHKLENDCCGEIRQELVNVKPGILGPYNKLRKPVDLYFEHLVGMASELAEHRGRLVPLLSLPLDCQVIASTLIFSERDLRQQGLSRRSSYGHVLAERSYLELQGIVRDKVAGLSSSLGIPFHPIYFDLIWGGRLEREGRNLFELNP